MPQVGISMPKVLKDWLDNNCAKAGFRYPSQLAVDMLNEALRLPKYAKLPTMETSIMDETVNIGKNAGIIGSRKFSISGAVKDHNETIEGYKEALEKGWITKERYDELEKESEVMHKEVVDEECKKMDKQKQMREPTSEEKVEAEEPKHLGRLPKHPHPELENSEPKQLGQPPKGASIPKCDSCGSNDVCMESHPNEFWTIYECKACKKTMTKRN